MEIEGTIIQVLEQRRGVSKSTGNPWMAQGYVLATNEFHSKRIAFDVMGEDRIRRFGLQVGSYVKVFCEVESREYEGKWYTQVKAWDARGVSRDAQTGTQQAAPSSPSSPAESAPVPPAPTAPSAPNDEPPF